MFDANANFSHIRAYVSHCLFFAGIGYVEEMVKSTRCLTHYLFDDPNAVGLENNTEILRSASYRKIIMVFRSNLQLRKIRYKKIFTIHQDVPGKSIAGEKTKSTTTFASDLTRSIILKPDSLVSLASSNISLIERETVF